MGSILHFFELNQSNSSRKLLARKRHTNGVEAPRNSLEFPIETSQNYDVIQEDIPYSCQVKHQGPKMNSSPNGAPMKKLIDEEMSKRINNRRNSPSIVARLMGMDSFPSEVMPVIHVTEGKNEKPKSSILRNEPAETSSSYYTSSLRSDPVKQTRQDLLPHRIRTDSRQSTKSLGLTKPQPREHPQEELLQKFKKEFEAWQASKVWECAKTFEADNYIQQEKVNQILAQDNLNKEKMARYWEFKKDLAHRKSAELNSYFSTTKMKSDAEHGISLQREQYVTKQSQSKLRDDMVSNFTQLAITKVDDKQDRSLSPTRIVILKPSSEWNDAAGPSCCGSPEMLEKEGNMQDFLEEVKERLKSEIQGKDRSSSTAREIGSEASFIERSADTKQFARQIAKQIKESVTRDLGTTLVRSESTRSYRSEYQPNVPDSPGFINRDTRKLLSERLKNVVRNEKAVDPLIINGRSRMTKGNVKSQSMHDFSNVRLKMSNMEEKKTLVGSKPKSYRGEQKNVIFDVEPVSPRNLVRSLSAPVSGTAFGRLLLEDQHVMTGAHIRRKLEASEIPSPESKRKRKDGFNLKGTVSNLRLNFTLRGKLFGKKTQMSDESVANEFDSTKDIVTPPSDPGNFGIVQDNSTEVPPSPASVSSSSLDELYRPGHPSPVSPLEVPFIEDHSAPKVSRETRPVLPELRNLSEQFEDDRSEELANEEKPIDEEAVEVQDHAKAFIRDILITSGVHWREAFDDAFPKWDALTKPISEWVFEKVEEAYGKQGKLDDEGSLFCYGDTKLSHNMLFDLINEALPSVLNTSTATYASKKPALAPNMMPHGKKLLDDLWCQLQVYTKPPVDESNSVDSMVAWDVRTNPWFTVLHEDLDVIGRDMERAILKGLIDEIVWEMFPLVASGKSCSK